MFAGLHETEMALRQHQRFVARDRAQHRDAERLEGVRDQRAVPVAAQLVEHDAAEAHRRIVRGKARRDRRRRLRLARNIEHQQHRQAQARGEVRRRAGAAGVPGTPSNRPIAPSTTSTSARCAASAISASISVGRHRPGVEIDALAAGRGGMKRRVDVVGARFRRAHRDALPPQRAEQAERDRRLARARARRRDDQAACASPRGLGFRNELQELVRARRRSRRSRRAPAERLPSLRIRVGKTDPARRRTPAVPGWWPTSRLRRRRRRRARRATSSATMCSTLRIAM